MTGFHTRGPVSEMHIVPLESKFYLELLEPHKQDLY